MATTSRSPKRILQVAHALGKQRLRTYWHRFSPKKFTLPQLFACLVLKEFLRLDYRRLTALLEDAPSLAATIGLQQVPHFSSFQKAAARLLVVRRVQLLLDETVHAATQQRVMKRREALAAIDGTGFETRHISAYFVKRREKGCKTGYQTTTYTLSGGQLALRLRESPSIECGNRPWPRPGRSLFSPRCRTSRPACEDRSVGRRRRL